MKGKIEKFIELYSNFIEKRPFTLLTAAIFATALLASGGSKVETVEQSQEDLLPETIPTMKAYETLSSDFNSRGGTTYSILIETSPNHPNSNEIRDLRNPRALRFIKSVSKEIESLDKIQSVSAPTDLFNAIPSGKTATKEQLESMGEDRWSNFISKDYRFARIQIKSLDIPPQEQIEIAYLIQQTVKANNKPAGLKVSYTGQPFINQAFQKQTQKTMSLTGIVALLGVVIVVMFLFRSVFYGFTSLLALIFGVATGFGIFGWIGLNMSPATSGALTMGIGVAIDFGIQPIARYIEERRNLDIGESLEETLKGIVTPMTIGLIAANIGFLSLNVGRVTFLSDLGTLLTLTTIMAYISAFTVIPSALVIYDRYFTIDGTKGFSFSKITSKYMEEKN